jgi:hypothetical protein
MQVAHPVARLVGLRVGLLCPVVRIDQGWTSLAYSSAQMGIDGSAGHRKHSSFFSHSSCDGSSSSEIEGRVPMPRLLVCFAKAAEIVSSVSPRKLFYLRRVEIAHRDSVHSGASILFRKIICFSALRLRRSMYYSQ